MIYSLLIFGLITLFLAIIFYAIPSFSSYSILVMDTALKIADTLLIITGILFLGGGVVLPLCKKVKIY